MKRVVVLLAILLVLSAAILRGAVRDRRILGQEQRADVCLRS
jgi:hypothetical protein